MFVVYAKFVKICPVPIIVDLKNSIISAQYLISCGGVVSMIPDLIEGTFTPTNRYHLQGLTRRQIQFLRQGQDLRRHPRRGRVLDRIGEC